MAVTPPAKWFGQKWEGIFCARDDRAVDFVMFSGGIGSVEIE